MGWNDVSAPAEKYIGKPIKKVTFDSDEIIIKFDDGVKIRIVDDGQCCCEHRFMTCDDDVQDLVGGTLRNIEIKDGPEEGDDYDVHEIQFLEISTDKTSITVANHNKHNGYYGGFCVKILEIE